jgi:hypothetical protein
MSDGGPLEIACDESGSEGEKLIGTTTDVFAHASVRLSTESAMRCLQEIRRRAPSRAVEYKAYLILRERHRAALVWLLGPTGPLHGHAHVYLVDKAYLVVSKAIELLVTDRPAATMAATLYREGRRAPGHDEWTSFLVASNNLMRARNRQDTEPTVDSFFRAVDALRHTSTDGQVREILDLLRQAGPHAEALRARFLDNPDEVPPLDPLIPAIVRAVDHWSDDGRPVSIVHDRQNVLSDKRIAYVEELCGGAADIRLADSRSDLRVQVADILAGAARKTASAELDGRGDPELTALLRPYVDHASLWGDNPFWGRECCGPLEGPATLTGL